MNWIDYREKLGIGFEDSSKFQMCENRIENLLWDLKDYYDEDDLMRYVNTIGAIMNRNSRPIVAVIHSLNKSTTLVEYISKYVAFLNSAKKVFYVDQEQHYISELFETIFCSTLEHFRIPYEICRDEDGVFIFPQGVPEFDTALVSDNLLWLRKYPETEKAWGDALRAYSNGADPSDVADKFRRTLERFFQNFFQSDKSLENLKPEYGRFLREHNIPGEVAGNLETVVQQYATFMNNYVKHHDRATNDVLEYIMYQTGNIIRLLIKLSTTLDN